MPNYLEGAMMKKLQRCSFGAGKCVAETPQDMLKRCPAARRAKKMRDGLAGYSRSTPGSHEPAPKQA